MTAVRLVQNKMAHGEETWLLSRHEHRVLLPFFVDSNFYCHFTVDGPSKIVSKIVT